MKKVITIMLTILIMVSSLGILAYAKEYYYEVKFDSTQAKH